MSSWKCFYEGKSLTESLYFKTSFMNKCLVKNKKYYMRINQKSFKIIY